MVIIICFASANLSFSLALEGVPKLNLARIAPDKANKRPDYLLQSDPS